MTDKTNTIVVAAPMTEPEYISWLEGRVRHEFEPTGDATIAAARIVAAETGRDYVTVLCGALKHGRESFEAFHAVGGKVGAA